MFYIFYTIIYGFIRFTSSWHLNTSVATTISWASLLGLHHTCCGNITQHDPLHARETLDHHSNTPCALKHALRPGSGRGEACRTASSRRHATNQSRHD